MRRRALLALLGTSTVLGGCLGEPMEKITGKYIEILDSTHHFHISDRRCFPDDGELLEILQPVSTGHQVSLEQHQQLVDRFGMPLYGFYWVVKDGGQGAPGVRVGNYVPRGMYNKLTVSDRFEITSTARVEIGGEDRTFATSMEIKERGEELSLDCSAR